jgi:hypothetical protein
MAKASISIGVDDATGQPANAPEGPYITDADDGSARHRKRSTRANERQTNEPARPRHRHPDRPPDLASRRKVPARP